MSLGRRTTHRWLPRAAALVALLVGAANIASALTPNVRWRGHLLLDVEPVEAIRIFHALALPAGAALLLVAPHLWSGRRRACQVAIGLMVLLGAFDLLKGLDVEETAITWLTAAGLYAGRSAFRVRHDPLTLRGAAWRVPALGLGTVGLVMLVAWAEQGRPSGHSVLRETGDLLAWRTNGPLHFRHHHVLAAHVAWVPLSVHLVEIATLIAIAYVVFRPLAAPRALPDPRARQAAAELIRAHGRDTLSFFKLRCDKNYFFNDDRSAFVGYRIENGVVLVSGDPVGPAESFRGLLADLRAFADDRGLKLGAVGASEAMVPLYEELGLRTIYLGDEAIVDCARFSLEGRPIRKVRQSVTRLSKAGYTAALHPFGELDAETLAACERVLELGRLGAPERGFSMAMDTLTGDHADETLVLVARDGDGVKGVLHFVPVYGRPAVSLSFMRRDPATPNGLTEFMVVRAIELLREREVAEMSLNFATAAKYLHSPERNVERVLGKLAEVANPFFQIESLYRFNAKFFPRWEPRYLVYEGRLGLPRVGLAAMWAEGQLPKPALRAR